MTAILDMINLCHSTTVRAINSTTAPTPHQRHLTSCTASEARFRSSKSGSADVLEALGINLSADAQAVTNSVVTVGIGFCFAPNFHPAMKYAAPVRKELGIPTVFNILGPLANPAQPKAMVVGVANLDRAQLVAEVLSERGCFGFVVRGDDGLDEITTTSTAR